MRLSRSGGSPSNAGSPGSVLKCDMEAAACGLPTAAGRSPGGRLPTMDDDSYDRSDEAFGESSLVPMVHRHATENSFAENLSDGSAQAERPRSESHTVTHARMSGNL